MPKPTKYHQHGSQNLYKIHEKNQGCAADAFLERFGAASGCQMLDFGSQNLQNIIVDAERHRRTPGTPAT